MEFEQIEKVIREARIPQKPGALAQLLGVTEEQLMDGIAPYLEEGRLSLTKRGAVALPEQMGYISGEYRATQGDAAFFTPDSQGDDYFLPRDKRMGAMNRDRVLVRATKKGSRRTEGEVVKILRRSTDTLVGEYNAGYVKPSDTLLKGNIAIPAGGGLNAFDGALVVVEILRYPDEDHLGEGRIVEVLGSKGAFDARMQAIMHKHGVHRKFPKAALREAESLPDAIAPADAQGREDLRGMRIFTIDGADAKDLDDAVSIERLENGNLRLGVHIADAGHYVTAGSALDGEAWLRGTSVYMLNTVVPMLPEKLSNGICSLHGGVDRLTLSAFIELDRDGQNVNLHLCTSVINSAARLTYSGVNDLLMRQDASAFADMPEIVEDLRTLDELRQRLYAKRLRRGTVDMDLPEVKIELDGEGVPIDIQPRERGNAERLIEECMLCANEAVAEYLYKLEMPCLYRVHETPDPEKLESLVIFLKNLGISTRGLRGEVHPSRMQQVMQDAKGTGYENIVGRVMLRSMQKAVYSVDNKGHFGLGAAYYCHFTSPIRRYPDLVVHRMIKMALDGPPAEGKLDALKLELAETATQTSARERAAMESERDADDMAMARYMANHLGEEFSGIISGVTEHGFFVELDNLAEGFVRVTTLDDYFVLDRPHYLLRGQRSGFIYRMGDKVRVVVSAADTETNRVEFDVVD